MTKNLLLVCIICRWNKKNQSSFVSARWGHFLLHLFSPPHHSLSHSKKDFTIFFGRPETEYSRSSDYVLRRKKEFFCGIEVDRNKSQIQWGLHVFLRFSTVLLTAKLFAASHWPSDICTFFSFSFSDIAIVSVFSVTH